MVRQTLTAEQIAERGDQIYRDRLQAAVESQHFGRFLIMDVLSGDFEIDDRDVSATSRLLQRQPDGLLYGLRIGHAAAYHLGSSISAAISRP